jgi:protein-disulfide isomerase
MLLHPAAATLRGAPSAGRTLGLIRLAASLVLMAGVFAVAMAPAGMSRAAEGKSSLFTAEQQKEIGRLVREYLLANPEVLVEVSAELEKRRKIEEEAARSQVLSEQKDQIFRSPHDFVLGDENAKITVVEFFDYNCGWCKRALTEINKFTEKDPNVRIVMKEFPIFGDNSQFAAKAALASKKQGKYWEFHQALMKERQVTRENTLDIAKSVGIDVEALNREMENPLYDQVLAENTQIAQALGMQGTPGFIIDSKVNYGYLPANELHEMVADIRKEGCKIC